MREKFVLYCKSICVSYIMIEDSVYKVCLYHSREKLIT